MKSKTIFKKLFYTLFALLYLSTLSTPIFAESGLSEMGRAKIYRLKDNIVADILPGGEGAKGYDSIAIHRLIKTENKDVAAIYGTDGEIYEVDNSFGKVGFSTQAYITDNIIWNHEGAVNIDTGEVLFTGCDYEVTLSSELVDVKMLDTDGNPIELPEELPNDLFQSYEKSKECKEYLSLLMTHDLSFDSDETKLFNIEYLEDNHEVFGEPYFLQEFGQGVSIAIILFAISVIIAFAVYLFFAIAIYRYFAKKGYNRIFLFVLLAGCLIMIPGSILILLYAIPFLLLAF